jgi:hypothetical protein
MIYNTDSERQAEQVAIAASNIKTGTNPPFVLEDFFAIYPQFGPATDGTYIIPTIMTQIYLNLANACIKEARWHSYWEIGMGFFIAHFCTLYVQGMADPDSGAAAILKAGQLKGLETSVSVGDVSVSTDYSIIANGIDGWANWMTTSYGVQLAAIGKMLGKGGMCIR